MAEQTPATIAILSPAHFMIRPFYLPCVNEDAPNSELLQIADKGGNRVDLCFAQAVRYRAHDRRGIRFGWILTPLFAPIHQFLDDIGIELARQPRNLSAAAGVRPMAGGACRDIGVGHAVFEYLPSQGDELLWRPADRAWIETPEMRSKSRY